MKDAGDILTEAAETFNSRKLLYGMNYINAGKALDALFPNGLLLKTPEDHMRYHIFTWIVGKLSRYAVNWETGHQDSIHDAVVYCAMLEAFDGNIWK